MPEIHFQTGEIASNIRLATNLYTYNTHFVAKIIRRSLYISPKRRGATRITHCISPFETTPMIETSIDISRDSNDIALPRTLGRGRAEIGSIRTSAPTFCVGTCTLQEPS
jgi:hypothetical protein